MIFKELLLRHISHVRTNLGLGIFAGYDADRFKIILKFIVSAGDTGFMCNI